MIVSLFIKDKRWPNLVLGSSYPPVLVLLLSCAKVQLPICYSQTALVFFTLQADMIIGSDTTIHD